MRHSYVAVGLAAALAVVVGSSTATAERGRLEPPSKRTEVTPDWQVTEQLFQEMVNRNAPKSDEQIAQELATHEVGRDLAAGRVSVLVHMEPNAVPGVDVRKSVRAFAAQNGGVVRYEYGPVMPDVANLRGIPEGRLQALRQMPGVSKVELDQYHADVVRLHDSTPLINGLQSQVTGAGFNVDGAGVRICVVDTGIDSDHVMFSDRIDTSAGYDFYNDDADPEDDHGHGSHCSGIALGGTGLSVDFGCGAGSQPFQGVAPGATLIGCKVLNQFGGGVDSDIIAGIDYCADQTASGAQADVISMSIGTGAYSGPCTHSWAVAANNAVANGVVAVAASGNENNSNAMGSPACGADVIAVGATYKADYPTCEDDVTNWNWSNCTDNSPVTDQIVCFSNESDYLDVTAPGANIWSASNASGGSSIVGSAGTSMACPHVSGLAALVLDADSALTPADVRQLIRDGAIDLGTAGFDRAYGYGRIDVLNTLALVTPCQTNADCDDGLFCNGAETCSSGTCLAGSDPCPGEDCDEVNDVCVPLVCDDDGTCESGEDCDNCPNDCISGSSGGAVCGNGVCEAGDGEDCVSCPSDCNGVQTGRPSGRFCCGATEGCGDSRCTSSGWSCTETPSSGSSYCCGDLICEGDEDATNCAIDCAFTCSVAADCDDGVACTDDECIGGVCSNTANDANCPDDGLFCTGTEYCDAVAGCSSTGDPCAAGETCNETTDTCDQSTCAGNKEPCSVDADCCSLNCNGGSCRGN